eukprot:m.89541 g.89541  ORF g.89541 m.89541 type:complete len:186 (+) comp16443_c0_seq4:391-948(+)
MFACISEILSRCLCEVLKLLELFDCFLKTALQWELREWLVDRLGYVTVESVVSGPGLANVYNFLVAVKGWPAAFPNESAATPKSIADKALQDGEKTCTEALNMLVDMWAAECRAMALRTMPHGGLYVAGGLAPKLLVPMKDRFVEAFCNGDSLMGSIIRNFPVYAVTNEFVGMMGALARAHRLLL